jgi:hypothetical protein
LVTLSRPSQTPLVVPGRLKRCVLAVTHQVTSFVKQHRGALSIVDRHFEKFRVKSDDFEGEIGGSVCVAMPNIPVPPIVRAAKGHEVFENESLTIESLLLQKCDCLLDLFALVGLKFVRAYQQRDIPNCQNYQGSNKDPRYSFKKATLLPGRLFRGFRIGSRLCRGDVIQSIVSQWTSAATTQLVRAGVD